MSVFEQNDKRGYFFQINHAERSLYLRFYGQAMELDRNAAPHVRAFTLDGIYYQFLITAADKFATAAAGADDAQLLTQHAEWEVAAAKRTPSPLTRFEDLGNRPRDALGITPELTFKLWRLYDPENDEVSQYFVTTVFDDQIASLSAIVSRAKNQQGPFFQVLEGYAGDFRFLEADQCQR